MLVLGDNLDIEHVMLTDDTDPYVLNCFVRAPIQHLHAGFVRGSCRAQALALDVVPLTKLHPADFGVHAHGDHLVSLLVKNSAG